MKNEQIKEITSKAIERLVAALNEGRNNTLTTYLTAMAKFHRYSLRNNMLIAMQKSDLTDETESAIMGSRGGAVW